MRLWTTVSKPYQCDRLVIQAGRSISAIRWICVKFQASVVKGVSNQAFRISFNTATDNGRAWVAIPTFTDVEFWIAVFDTVGGQYKEYHSPPGNRTLIYDPITFIYP